MSERTTSAARAASDDHDDYLLQSSDLEHQRLMAQAQILHPWTDRSLRLGGLRPGMSVLDLGSGMGDVSMLAGEMVGPRGRVLGVDRDPVTTDKARRRARNDGFGGSVEFELADLDDFDAKRAFRRNGGPLRSAVPEGPRRHPPPIRPFPAAGRDRGAPRVRLHRAEVIHWTELASRTEGTGGFAWVGMCAAVGGAVRTWRDYIDATEDRAVRAEASEEEARRRVAEERLRIARELHDVIAHHIALITLQAEVARHLLRSEPDQADTALGHIRHAGRDVLDELSSLLYVLRQPDDGTHAAHPAEPVPGLSRLGRLLESMDTAGLRVRHRQAGPGRPLPTAVDLAAYRIVQQGLTNAHEQGSQAGTDLLVEYRPDALHIEISNPVRTGSLVAPAPVGTGHGLTGMRERSHAVGGMLHAGAGPDGRFRLRARLPLPHPEVPATGPSRRPVWAPRANITQGRWR